MSKHQENERRNSAPLFVWCAIVTAFATCALTIVVTTTVLRPHQLSIGVWISEFFKTSGFAGVCAIAAAGIAFWSIARQLKVTREGYEQARLSSDRSLDSQRIADANRSWWETFEWAVTRAIPARNDELPLPYVAVLSTFEALAKSASTDVQRASIAGVMDEVARRNEGSGATDDSDDESADDPRGRERLLAALENFVTETAGTRASSKVAESQLYEGVLLTCLEELERDGSLELHSFRESNRRLKAHELVIQPDAVVKLDGVTIAIDVKNYSSAVDLFQRATLSGARRFLDHGGVERVALISPVAPEGTTPLDDEVLAINWRIRDTPSRLLQGLREVANSTVG